MGSDLADLEERRARLYAELAATGDFRRGSVSATHRRCGKPNCACARPGHPGHGPRHLWTRSVDGRTEGHQLAPGPELAKVTREVAEHRRFTSLSAAIVEVNEAICEARPVSPLADGEAADGTGDQRGGSGSGSEGSSRPR